MFLLVIVMIAVAVFVFSFSYSGYEYLMLLAVIDLPIFKVTGLVLLAFSLVWTTVSQAKMGASWRIGIDSRHKTELVVRGLFKVSRNPIFLGMACTLAGLFLATPNVLTLIAVIVGVTLVRIQVRLEEEHLATLHEASYADYCRRVRRWI
jgi:protein-S-isoprenylcysteine O-methyltransferase Ste14